MKSTQSLVDFHVGRLTVLEFAGKDERRNLLWRCRCDCGTIIVTRGSNLTCKKGGVRSCGCLAREVHTKHAKQMGAANITHGLSRTPTWSSWSMMMQRCFNPKRNKHYGDRGIKPCGFIAESPANLIALIGERPEGKWLEKVNNEAGYTCGQCEECKLNGWPLNVAWRTPKEQQKNKRNTVRIVMDGVSLLRYQWAEKLGKSIGWVRCNLKQYEVRAPH
jgi:hypothetical protein